MFDPTLVLLGINLKMVVLKVIITMLTQKEFSVTLTTSMNFQNALTEFSKSKK